tara:strand:- start:8100 stop:9779 length:1680 start_codon:yes stop_codon:yes gene_type:complete
MHQNSLSGCRFLLVDDDESYHITVGELFSSKNASVSCAFGIEQAKKLLVNHSYDLVLLDSYLMDGFGIDLLEFMARRDIFLPVIIITSDDERQSMQKYFLLGVSGYLIKPFNFELMEFEIQRSIKAHINEQKLSEQYRKLELMLNEQKQEEKLAKHVYRHLSKTFSKLPEGIDTYMRSNASFNGDFFGAEQLPNGNTLMILMDASGHGLASAFSILPAVSTMRAMLHKGMSIQNIIHEINTKLCAEIPEDRFVAMIAIEINYLENSVSIINAGMPNLLIINGKSERVACIKSESLPLGIVESNDFNPFTNSIQLNPDYFLVMCSDGLVEQKSLNGDMFGKTALRNIIDSHTKPKTLLSQIIEAFNSHCSETQVDDDVSVCIVSLGDLTQLYQGKHARYDELRHGHIHLEMELAGDLLAAGNIISIIDDMLTRINLNTVLRQKAFTVVSELISNALDHGVLRLDSSLKHDFDSFGEYLEERAVRLGALEQHDRILLILNFNPEIGQLYLDIEDSGNGYEERKRDVAGQEALFGRGLELVNKLCEQMQVFAPGNRTSVLLK